MTLLEPTTFPPSPSVGACEASRASTATETTSIVALSGAGVGETGGTTGATGVSAPASDDGDTVVTGASWLPASRAAACGLAAIQDHI